MLDDNTCDPSEFVLLTDETDLLITDPCTNPTTFTIGNNDDIGSDYSVPVSFTPKNIVIEPVVCVATFECDFLTELSPPIDLCTYQNWDDYTGTGNPLD